jgi:hypothetical protein
MARVLPSGLNAADDAPPLPRGAGAGGQDDHGARCGQGQRQRDSGDGGQGEPP